MLSFGYLVSSSFASWSSQNQKKLAMMRVGPQLEILCARKFQLEASEQTTRKWETFGASFLDELLDFEIDLITLENQDTTTREEIRQAKKTWCDRKVDLLIKYFGHHFAESFRRRIGLEHDAMETYHRVRDDLHADYLISVIR